MLTARNSVHKSAAFGRNRFSHHTGRKGRRLGIGSLGSVAICMPALFVVL